MAAAGWRPDVRSKFSRILREGVAVAIAPLRSARYGSRVEGLWGNSRSEGSYCTLPLTQRSPVPPVARASSESRACAVCAWMSRRAPRSERAKGPPPTVCAVIPEPGSQGKDRFESASASSTERAREWPRPSVTRVGAGSTQTKVRQSPLGCRHQRRSEGPAEHTREGRGVVTLDLTHGRCPSRLIEDARLTQSDLTARDDRVEQSEVDRHVERRAVTGHPALAAQAHRRDLRASHVQPGCVGSTRGLHVVRNKKVDERLLEPGYERAKVPAGDGQDGIADQSVSYTHLRAHETVLDLVC